MYKCGIIHDDETVWLTGQEDKWQIFDIQGLNPPSAQITLTNIVGMDGALYNSSQLTTRNIVIYLRLNGDVEANRHTAEGYFAVNKQIRLRYVTETRDMYIDCRIERCEYDPFTSSEIMQISLICPDPLWKDMEERIFYLSNDQDGVEFPLYINRSSKIPFSELKSGRTTRVWTGTAIPLPCEITVEVLGSISSFIIQNVLNGEFIKITKSLTAGDVVRIDTDPMNLTVVQVNGMVEENIFSYVDPDSTMFQLINADQIFGYSVDNHAGDNNVRITMKFRKRFRGV